MPSLLASLPRALLVALLAAVALGAGCSREPPAVCEAYVACFHPADDAASPYTLRDPEDLGRPEQLAEMKATFGPGGECWKNGPTDGLWGTCERLCAAILYSECAAFDRGEEDAACVQPQGGATVFKAPDVAAVPCASLEATPARERDAGSP
jgi:hypothetical protein